MGVRGLQTFMEHNVADGASQVNIKDIINTYKRETGRNDVVIVVDGCSCLRPFYGGLDWVCGGQIKEYVEKLKTFIKAFTDLGVELVFFFDGPTQTRKRPLWIDRRLRNLDDVNKVFNKISNGNTNSSQIPHKLLQLPPATTYLASFAIQTSPGCKFHRTIKECDEEIAEYAVRNRCFAILGQDTDYVIFDGPQYYLSAMRLNVQKMTTVNYNRWALARQLKISVDHLPLFATLVGNDIVRHEELSNFHKKIMRIKGRNVRPNLKDVIYSVAHYVRDITNRQNVYEALPSISQMVFGNETEASRLHLSVRSYSVNIRPVPAPESFSSQMPALDPPEHWKRLQKYAEQRFIVGDLDSMIFAVMHDLPYESSTGLEDFSRTELPPSGLAYRHLRQRLYGIVLFEKPIEDLDTIFEEWVMSGPESLWEAEQVSVIFPEEDTYPGLLVLWDESDESEETLQKKWVLTARCVSAALDPARIQSVPATLLAPTLLLYYLCHEVSPKFLEPWEVDAFIATAVVLPTHDTTSLSRIYIQHVNPRAVQLACIFVRGISVVKMLMDAVGHPVPKDKVAAWYFFDGKLFHATYQKAQAGQQALDLCRQQVSLLEEFNLLRSIILPNNL